jgi:hypothetical protein
LTAPWAGDDERFADLGDSHVRIFKELDDERRHPSRMADEQDSSASPGQRHVEKTALLGARGLDSASPDAALPRRR